MTCSTTCPPKPWRRGKPWRSMMALFWCISSYGMDTVDNAFKDMLENVETVETEKVYHFSCAEATKNRSPKDTENDTTFSFSQESEIVVPRNRFRCIKCLFKFLFCWKRR